MMMIIKIFIKINEYDKKRDWNKTQKSQVMHSRVAQHTLTNAQPRTVIGPYQPIPPS